jgi:hypothetical protein
MRGLSISSAPQLARTDAPRADIAVFVGRVRRAPGTLPPAMIAGLCERGWLAINAHECRPLHQRSLSDIFSLRDVPVPLSRVEDFDALFERGRGDGLDAALAVAVAVFFASGGRHAWVVRVGDPVAANAVRDPTDVGKLIPGVAGSAPVSAADRSSWHGMSHVLGIPEAALLLLPDLPEYFAKPSVEVTEQALPALDIAPQFVECSVPAEAAQASAEPHRSVTAPALDDPGFAAWANALQAAHTLLARLRPDMQLIAALPLPTPELAGSGNAVSGFPAHLDQRWDVLAARHLQLAWPWLVTGASARLPGGVEAPDARLAGLIAATTLARGAHRTPAGTPTPAIRALVPHVDSASPLAERLSVFADSATGLLLLSDVTTARETQQRPANVRRILGLVARAIRSIGEAAVFDASGAALWLSLRLAVERLLDGYWRAGALHGATAADAYSVECGTTTMSQADLDAGRTIVQISLAPAASVERIAVTLTLDEGQTPQLEAA